MKERTSFNSGDEGLAAVLRRFPTHAAQMRTLIERNENFRTMCDDLACVEQALLAVEQMPSDIRDDRRREFTELVDGLAVEIERALSQVKIVSIGAYINRSQ
ncbi:hypothetical protein [Rhizobium sp. PL01]|jgi:hypothetical protein|uniref:hypothetical protein n=1 Tax=Rhizobium sp. PL01 TaxID=3085631 RepID=UPI00298144FA|nr:hypothetical protein [Rhizobium sp. PL01]MDW5317342.1 hypothetical protein [Rhizobium sp. PL01]